MGGLRNYLPIFLLFLCVFKLTISERYGNDAKYISIVRKTRSAPTVIEASEASENVRRVRRDTTKRASTASNIRVHQPNHTAVPLNDSHQQVMIQWAGEGSDVIVCVTRNSQQKTSSISHVYISQNYGDTYENVTHRFKTEDGTPAIINKFYKNDKYNNRFVFTDVIHKYIYVTSDYGTSVLHYKVEFAPSEVAHHPIDSSVLLAHDTEDPARKLWISENFGASWRMIGLNVKSFFWSDFTSPPTLYLERGEPDQSSTVLSSQDLFSEDKLPTIVIRNVEEFEEQDEFLFVVKKSALTGGLYLMISYQNGHFLRAEFPNELKHQHYFIADISEGQVMVCVAHDYFWSNLYVSSVPRSTHHPIEFTLSLERIFFFMPSSTWNSTWLSGVAEKKFADLHPVEGVRGVYIASQLQQDKTNGSDLRPEHLTSYITFDQGAQWKPLQPPRKDVDGEIVNCKRAENCSLHLSQEFSHLYPTSDPSSILSRKSAPGLILATGTVGTSLKGHSSIYLSSDAGISWYQVLKGVYLYAFGDHGGVMVAVQPFGAEGEVNELVYSTDEGESWNSYKFYDEKMRVFGMMTEPGENTTIFTIFGSKPGKHQWIFVKVNMTEVFPYTCNENDYRKWSPSDGRSGRQCLLGRKQTYERRISHANCYNGLNYDRPIYVEDCPCDREDFECDFGFILDTNTKKCVQDRPSSGMIDPYAIPPSCHPGKFYNRTKGYRLIPGDSCVAGRGYQYAPSITACPVSEDQEFLLVSARQEILRYDLINPESGLQRLPIPGLKMVIALDFDLRNNCIYWSDVVEKKIYRLCFDGLHDVEILVEENLRSVEGLAFDWIAQNLYFVDGERKTLEVIRADMDNFGRMRRVLLDDEVLDNPRGIALHPVRGCLYITDWSESSPKVAKAFMDGTNFTILFGADKVGWPNGITIDFQTERIFFADAKLDYIASADLDGSNMRKIISESEKVLQPFAVGIYKSTVFWDDWTVYKVLQADKEFGWGITPIVGNFTRKGLVDLKVFGHLSQQGKNRCSANQTQCNYLCMAHPNNGSACLCPSHFHRRVGPAPDHTVACLCPDQTVVKADGTCNIRNNTCAPKYFRCGNSRCIPEQWLCDGDNDCGDDSDENASKCGRDECQEPALLCDNGHCITHELVCNGNNDCGDNSDEKECPDRPCPNNTFACNNGRCIHSKWVCDMEDDCYDGSDEANCSLPSHNNSTCRGTEFACGDHSNRCIPGVWQCDGENDCTDGSDETDCASYACEAWQFQCNDKKQCIFKSWECDGETDCLDHSDEVNCTNTKTPPPPPATLIPPGPQQNCSELMFRCDNGHCVPFWWRCDRLDDCGDRSDEYGCHNVTVAPPVTTPVSHTCHKDQFQCRSGSCIWETWVCDSDKDCPEGEDEENCPQTLQCASHREFQCRRSGGCVPTTRICDGHQDCADGSDEDGCGPIPVPNLPCPNGYFMCDGGACHTKTKHCDGNHDCVDLSDEQNCTSFPNKTFSVISFTVLEEKNTSVKISWTANRTTSVLEYMPSLVEKAKVGNPTAWKNYTWTANATYEFRDLEPYTSYVLKVYVRLKNSSLIYPPVQSQVFNTQMGVPDPPENIKVQRTADKVHVTWEAPNKANGNIRRYHVYMSPPNPPTQVNLPADVKQLMIRSQSITSDVTFWVTAANDLYVSEPSEKKKLVALDQLQVSVLSATATSVTLSWGASQGVDGYSVSHNRPENEYLMGLVTKNTTEAKMEVTGLAPGLEYDFEVRAYKGDLLGPASFVRETTKGSALVAVTGLQAELTSDQKTTIKLSWTEPPYKGKKKDSNLWEYRVVWGKTVSEVKHGINSNITMDTTFTISGLEACQSYLLAVMVWGKLGIGPVSKKQKQTGADPLAPPKNLDVKLDNTTLNISWEASCPQQLDSSIDYMIKILDTVKKQTSIIQLLGRGNRTFTHSVDVHRGGQYEVTVSSARPNARPTSPPVAINGPVIPPPVQLTYHEGDGSFFWRNNRTLPQDILLQNTSFVLYISENKNMSDPIEVGCAEPPLKVPQLAPGLVYYAAVSLKDADGYLSPYSQVVRFEKPIGDEIVVSQSSVVGVGVSVFLVVAALIAVVVALAVRHRRLARSFLTFANTHYDRSQGTTLITTNEPNLDEDDDSPMIRGFSDDEPLVIA